MLGTDCTMYPYRLDFSQLLVINGMSALRALRISTGRAGIFTFLHFLVQKTVGKLTGREGSSNRRHVLIADYKMYYSVPSIGNHPVGPAVTGKP